jgi:hypothetical protein
MILRILLSVFAGIAAAMIFSLFVIAFPVEVQKVMSYGFGAIVVVLAYLTLAPRRS